MVQFSNVLDSVRNPALSGSAEPTSAAGGSDMAMFGLYEISKLLNAPLRLEGILASVANVLSSFLQMRLSVIVILDADGDPEIVATAGGAGESHGKGIEILPQAVIDRLVATQTPLVVQNVAADPLFSEAAPRITRDLSARVAFLGVPIKAGEKVVGTLSIDRVRDGSSTFKIDEDLRFLTMVGNLIGQTVRLHRMLSSDRQRLLDERRSFEKALNQELTDKGKIPTPKVSGIVGESPQLRRVLDIVATVAKSNSTVLLRGESGTGKELFARALHDMSPRKDKPFVKLNCAALPESVLESELFGHEKGAFTGAVAQRLGRFELANGGTLLLDEIGEISPAFQAKLLRVLQEGEFERVGGTKTLKVNVRLVCATNRDLEVAVSKGDFRSDLYYRINVVPIFLPPLRERPGDIALLARAFLDRFNKENGRKIKFATGAMSLIQKCYFPGNVRELENCVRRTATLCRGDMIDRDDFVCAKGECMSALLWTGGSHQPAGVPDPSGPQSPFYAPAEDERHGFPDGAETAGMGPHGPMPATPQSSQYAPEGLSCSDGNARSCEFADECSRTGGSRQLERQRLVDAMEKAGWVQAKAARVLGLTPRQVGYALRKHGIELKRL